MYVVDKLKTLLILQKYVTDSNQTTSIRAFQKTAEFNKLLLKKYNNFYTNKNIWWFIGNMKRKMHGFRKTSINYSWALITLKVIVTICEKI